jgi:hypothetical protein
MKAVRQYKQQWEEEQFLQLVHFAEQIYKALNLFIYISYQLIKLVFNLIHLVLFTETNHQLIKDEQWIYRQIK